MNTRLFIPLFLVTALILFSQCEKEYIQNNNSLYFNTDTLIIDTVLAQVGSTTQKSVRLFNHSKQNTENVSVRLAGGDDSPFLINVNGNLGGSDEIRLRGKDSLFVFLQLKPLSINTQTSYVDLLTDRIIVESGEHQQSVLVKCPVIYAIEKKGEIRDAVWQSDEIFFVSDDVVIPFGHNLIIEPGVSIFFNNQAKFIVEGGLNVNGSCDNSVFFRGYRHDNVTSSVKYEQVSKQWGGIFIKDGAEDISFENAVIMNANPGISIGEVGGESVSVQLFNTRMQYNGDVNILAYNASLEMYNCLLSNAEQQIVMYGGRKKLVHCTLANYYEQRNLFSIPAIELLEADTLGNTYIFQKSEVVNSIIYGINSNEIVVPENSLEDFYLFNRVILRSTSDVEGTKNVAPNFVSIKNYDFDFRLLEESPAIDYGIAIDDEKQNFDLDCIPRSDRFDAGVFQWL